MTKFFFSINVSAISSLLACSTYVCNIILTKLANIICLCPPKPALISYTHNDNEEGFVKPTLKMPLHTFIKNHQAKLIKSIRYKKIRRSISSFNIIL
ncbi:hypothetical protein BD408DRAFT_265574 [Parasitella parasitica]|nr:hypothetical protein BD408DRAFT_265574 [Parasitella parasitica]